MGRKKEQAVVDVVINNEQARRKVKELSADLDDLRKKRREALKGGNTSGAAAYDKEIKALQKELNQYKKTVVDVDHVLRNLNKVPLNQLEDAQRNLRKNLKLLNQDSKEYKATLEKLNRVQRQIDTAQKQMQASGKGFMGSLGSALPLGLTAMFYSVSRLIVPFKNFQYMMAKVGAVSNATGGQFKELKENAKELGASTEYTATQVAELQLNYARLGFTPGQILQITSATLDLATATGSGLASVADVAGSTLRAFGYDGSQMTRVVDVMAASFNKSALDLGYFSESMKYVAPIAAKAGVSLEQTTAMLGILADRGIRGSQAGTALKRILSEISTEGKSVSEALVDLNEKGLTLADAEDEVGKYAMTALTVLADNAPAVEGLTTALNNSAGAAEHAAAIMRDNIQGDLDTFKSKLEGLIIRLGDGLNPVIRGTIQLFTALLTPLSVLGVAFAAWFVSLKAGRAAVEAYNVAKRRFAAGTKDATLSLVSETAAMNVNTMAAKRNLVQIRSMPAATKAWAAAKLLLAGNFRAAGVAAKAFFASIGPIGWIAMAIGLAVGAMAAFSGATKKASEASSQLALELSQERATHDDLKRAVTESAQGSQTRAEAIRLINERYKEYLPYLISEKMSNEEVAAALDYASQKMEENIKMKIRAQEAEKLQKEMLDAERGALDKLMEAYLSRGDKTKEQVALAQQQLGALVVQLEKTGDKAAFVAGAARVFGMSVEEMNSVITTSVQATSGAYTHTARKYGFLVDQVEAAFDKVTEAARKTKEELGQLDALVGNSSANPYQTMTLDQLSAALSTVNSKLSMKNALTAEQRVAAEAERKEIQEQLRVRKLQAQADNTYIGVLNRLKKEKQELEAQLNSTDGANKKEISRIQALIAAKQKEIDLYENKKTTNKTGRQWSISSDESYLKAKAELREKQMSGEIATEEEYSRRLLALEIQTLEKRIEAGKEKGSDLAKLEEQLLDKRYQQQKAARDREKKLLEIAAQGDSAEDKENDAYEKQLRDLGLFGRELEEMTANEQAAYLQLKRSHYEKLSSIYVDELSKELSKQQKAIQRKATAEKQAHNDELAAADTFEKKKALLRKWYSEEELRRVRTDKQADSMLKRQYAAEEQAALKTDLEKMLATYQAIVEEVGETGLLANGVAATEKDIERLQKIIDDMKKQLAELGATPPPTLGGEDTNDPRNNVDVLGMTPDKWKKFYTNLKDGKFGMEEILAVAGAIGSAFSDVSNLMTAMEQRELKNYEKAQNKKKQLLERQLKSGTISQERYNEAVQRLDDETEAKREEIERKQAKRDKALAVFNSLINTAVAVTAALQVPFPMGEILAGIVAALGAVQTAAILATPLPGAEEGGPIGVIREQDGKRFDAEFSPRKRGFVHRPTVIQTSGGRPVLTGEAGTEYVVPNDLLRVPEVASMVNLIEAARLRGSFRPVNLSAAMAAGGIPGRESGGYVGRGSSTNGASENDASGTTVTAYDAELLREVRDVVGKLSRQLDKPLPVFLSIYGRDGLFTIQKKIEQQQRRAGIGGRAK
ncbi:phage tail tape measure protein [uncultured Rikenella sp.]|uniref:phage tail tape measure protein n=2 Tax=uncultured Rikenella sp. TaxID=368003 RepID=UPI00272CC2BD|nr:phage tail tape measure protein [uncultured Rikenella sp.]